MQDIGQQWSTGTNQARASRSPLPLDAAALAGLRDLLAKIVNGLYRRDGRFALYVTDGDGALALAIRQGELGWGEGGWVFSSLASRPRVFSAAVHAERGPLMTVPLLDRDDEVLGLIAFGGAPGERDFTRSEILVLEGVAGLLSAALGRSPAQEIEPARSARIALDRKDARRLQRRLMNESLPPGIGVTARAEYQPAFEVGGDFYTLKYLGDRTVGAAIGDVSGNGVSAALVMSRVVSDIDRALERSETPSRVLRAIDDRLSGVGSDVFVTVSCLRIDTGSRTVTLANAGHLPMIVRREDGEVYTCGGASGAPLGVLPADCVEEELHLAPRDIVLLVTDGLLEALDHPSGRRGMEVLTDLVRGAPHDTRSIDEHLRKVVDAARSRHALDDVTWVQLRLD